MNERRKLLIEEDTTGRSIIDGYEAADLGLPSGTLWATMNVGATSETDYGNYYKYGNGATAGATDTTYYTGVEELNSLRDTARQVWGGLWHMPTREQLIELIANTTYEWTSINGVNGGKFTSKTDSSKYIFLPAAGYLITGSQSDVGSNGYYWSSTPASSTNAFYLGFNSSDNGVSHVRRTFGFSVRPVHDAI